MKLIMVSLILMFAILGDFASEVFAVDHLGADCQMSICEQVDIHANEQSTPFNHESNDSHCHCHAGHLHLGIFFQAINYSNPISQINTRSNYGLYTFVTEEYFSEVIRPPIA